MSKEEFNYTDDAQEENQWKSELRDLFVASQCGTEIEKNDATLKVGQFYLNSAPAELYKYTSCDEFILDNLFHNKLWYSSPSNFNDVFDSRYYFDKDALCNNLISVLGKGQNLRKGSYAWKGAYAIAQKNSVKLEAVLDDFRIHCGVTCFSETNDNLLMWAHYADSHRGICIEYDLLSISNKTNFIPVPIIYTDKRVSVSSLDVENINVDAMRMCIYILTSKSTIWDYEQEWRIIRDRGACGTNWDENKKGAILDMVEPSSIILGCQIAENNEKKVYNFCNQNKINLYKMSVDKERFLLNKNVILDFS